MLFRSKSSGCMSHGGYTTEQVLLAETGEGGEMSDFLLGALFGAAGFVIYATWALTGRLDGGVCG